MRARSKPSQLIHSGATSCAALIMPRWKEARLRLAARPSIRKSLWSMVCLPAAFSIPVQFRAPSWSFRRTISVRFRLAPGRDDGSSKADAPSAVAPSASQSGDESSIDDDIGLSDVACSVAGQQHYEVGHLFEVDEPPR